MKDRRCATVCWRLSRQTRGAILTMNVSTRPDRQPPQGSWLRIVAEECEQLGRARSVVLHRRFGKSADLIEVGSVLLNQDLALGRRWRDEHASRVQI
jgi:hypothetical protein